eukprot:2217367-Pleurochrysis_carterae.AAC.1
MGRCKSVCMSALRTSASGEAKKTSSCCVARVIIATLTTTETEAMACRIEIHGSSVPSVHEEEGADTGRYRGGGSVHHAWRRGRRRALGVHARELVAAMWVVAWAGAVGSVDSRLHSGSLSYSHPRNLSSLETWNRFAHFLSDIKRC